MREKSGGIKVPDLFSTYDFLDVGDKNNYKVVSKIDGHMCGWIDKICIPKEKVKQLKEV